MTDSTIQENQPSRIADFYIQCDVFTRPILFKLQSEEPSEEKAMAAFDKAFNGCIAQKCVTPYPGMDFWFHLDVHKENGDRILNLEKPIIRDVQYIQR